MRVIFERRAFLGLVVALAMWLILTGEILKMWMADTLAMVAYGIVVGGVIIEWLILGLTPMQVISTRSIGTIGNILTGRPYGWWTNVVRAKLGSSKSEKKWVRFAWKMVVDTLIFVSFQLPLYVGILWLSGATLVQIIAGCGLAVMAMLTTGGIYGRWLDMCRHRIFRIRVATPSVVDVAT